MGALRVNVFKISRRPSCPGSSTLSILSRRPGRSIAGSTRSGLFVAAITKTPFLALIPSISVSIWLTTRSDDPVPSPDLLGQRESISSKKMTHGDETAARPKTARTARSLSPTNLFKSSGPATAMKLAPEAFATAFASKVLPQPGGPYKSTPAGASRPSDSNHLACLIGAQIARSSSRLSSTCAPTSSHVTSGMVVNPSRRADGCTLATADSKSSMRTAHPRSSSSLKGSVRSGCTPNILRMAESEASFTTDPRSAPTNPGVILASLVQSTSPSSLIPSTSLAKILARAGSSGIPTASSRSKRPARRNAGSRASGRFVAPRTTTCEPARSSIQVSIWATIRRSISLPALSRFGVIASISSKNSKAGAFSLASWNNARSLPSDSPDIPETISGAATL
mmetsp:Transcript_5938/g.14112  ORF Transcript_5938/g.14112 Transcript_5938/m.14112 type:complete len:396 (+) Transcript_5938:515-1702(+)